MPALSGRLRYGHQNRALPAGRLTLAPIEKGRAMKLELNWLLFAIIGVALAALALAFV